MYDMIFESSVKKDLKKIDKKVQLEIKDIHLSAIKKDPFACKPLSAHLKAFYSYHFHFNSTEYRIAYKVDLNKKIITIAMIATRENFYKILQRRLS